MPGPLSATCRIRRPGAVLSEQRTTPPLGAWRMALASRLLTTETIFSSSATAGSRAGTPMRRSRSRWAATLPKPSAHVRTIGGDVDDGGFELELDALQARDEHQVLHTAQHRVGVGADARDVVGILGCEAPGLFEARAEGEHDRQRRLQLVAEVGELLTALVVGWRRRSSRRSRHRPRSARGCATSATTCGVGARRPARRGRPTPRQLRSSRFGQSPFRTTSCPPETCSTIESAVLDARWGNFLPHVPRMTSLARADASHPHAARRHRRFRYARSAGRRALDRATPRGLGTHRTVRAQRRVAAWRFPSIPREPPARSQRSRSVLDCPNSCLGVEKYPTVQAALLFSMSL